MSALTEMGDKSRLDQCIRWYREEYPSIRDKEYHEKVAEEAETELAQLRENVETNLLKAAAMVDVIRGKCTLQPMDRGYMPEIEEANQLRSELDKASWRPTKNSYGETEGWFCCFCHENKEDGHSDDCLCKWKDTP
jgi:hypothetical protein